MKELSTSMDVLLDRLEERANFKKDRQALQDWINTSRNSSLVVHKSTPTQEKGLQPRPTYASKYTCNNSKRPSLRELIEEQVKITNNLSKKLLTVQNRAQVHRKPTGDLVPFHQGGSSLDLSIQGSKQTTKVLYLTYWSNPM
jgi:hypothetical protein